MQSDTETSIRKVNRSFMELIAKLPKQSLALLTVVVITGAVGSYTLLQSHASTLTVDVTAANSAITGSAKPVTNTTASTGQALQFGTVTSTPTPPSSGGTAATCPPVPAYPDANCTGWQHTGVTLTKVPGQATSGTGWRWNGYAVVSTGSNITISGLDIDGSMDTGNNTGVTIKNSYIRCTSEPNWCLTIGSGTSVIDTEIGGGSNGTTPGTAIGVWTGGPNNNFLRVHIHDTSDGMRTDGGTTVTDSYIHLLSYAAFPANHSDGSQTTASSQNAYPIVFIHNTIQGGNNDGIFIQAGTTIDAENNYLVYDNRAGQNTSFGIGGSTNGGNGPVTFKNNVFDNSFGAGRAIQTGTWPAGTVISGNKLLNGTPLP